jgi:hypothetical protein
MCIMAHIDGSTTVCAVCRAVSAVCSLAPLPLPPHAPQPRSNLQPPTSPRPWPGAQKPLRSHITPLAPRTRAINHTTRALSRTSTTPFSRTPAWALGPSPMSNVTQRECRREPLSTLLRCHQSTAD